MMDRLFAHQIERNIEIYVDDMVIKSKQAANAPDDLEKTLKTLLSVNLSLNLEKCIFGLELGKFLDTWFHNVTSMLILKKFR